MGVDKGIHYVGLTVWLAHPWCSQFFLSFFLWEGNSFCLELLSELASLSYLCSWLNAVGVLCRKSLACWGCRKEWRYGCHGDWVITSGDLLRGYLCSLIRRHVDHWPIRCMALGMLATHCLLPSLTAAHHSPCWGSVLWEMPDRQADTSAVTGTPLWRTSQHLTWQVSVGWDHACAWGGHRMCQGSVLKCNAHLTDKGSNKMVLYVVHAEGWVVWRMVCTKGAYYHLPVFLAVCRVVTARNGWLGMNAPQYSVGTDVVVMADEKVDVCLLWQELLQDG